MGDPPPALGNCWAATNEVIEEAGASAFGAEWVDPITPARRSDGNRPPTPTAGMDVRTGCPYVFRQTRSAVYQSPPGPPGGTSSSARDCRPDSRSSNSPSGSNSPNRKSARKSRDRLENHDKSAHQARLHTRAPRPLCHAATEIEEKPTRPPGESDRRPLRTKDNAPVTLKEPRATGRHGHACCGQGR